MNDNSADQNVTEEQLRNEADATDEETLAIALEFAGISPVGFDLHDAEEQDPAEESRRKLGEDVISCLQAVLESTDPNWNYIRIGCTFAAINGPMQGDVEVTEAALAAIPEELMLRISPDGEQGVVVYNKNHQIKLVSGRTFINFENCEEGVVVQTDGDECTVEMLGMSAFGVLMPHEKTETRPYTLERLRDELTWRDAMECQAVDVRYLPFLIDGHRMTLDDRRAAYAEAAKRHEAEALERAAEQERQRAEAQAQYDALSPEDKKRVDEERRQQEERDTLTRELLALYDSHCPISQ